MSSSRRNYKGHPATPSLTGPKDSTREESIIPISSTQQTRRTNINLTTKSMGPSTLLSAPLDLDQKTIADSIRFSKGPATVVTSKRPLSKRIMTITEGRGIAIEIGLCVFDVISCEFIISQV